MLGQVYAENTVRLGKGAACFFSTLVQARCAKDSVAFPEGNMSLSLTLNFVKEIDLESRKFYF